MHRSTEYLAGDLRFTELVAQFVGSVRQVRLLQEQQTRLSSFFSPKVMEGLNAGDGDSLNPSQKEITVLFCDVRGFSRKSEQLKDNLTMLLRSVSAALDVMADGILNQDGAIADFQGDAALGFWGWPVRIQEGPLPACLAALNIAQRFRNEGTADGGLPEGFSVGIGISHGSALAGRIGTNRQAKIGVFGPIVNQGARLETMTKQLGVPTCVDESTAIEVRRFLDPAEVQVRRLAIVKPKGMDERLVVYGLLPHNQYADMTERQLRKHEVAVDAVSAGSWKTAQQQLVGLQAYGPSRFLLRQMAILGNRPPGDWDGAFRLAEK